MAITKEKKADFNEKLVDFKNYLEELKKEANMYKLQSKKSKDMEPYFNIALATNSLKSINTCLMINELSTAILEINNNNYLETARKEIYNCISFIEKTVSNNIDGSLTENKDLLAKIERITPTQRLNLIKGLREAIKKTNIAFGPNSKWKWSWPDIHYRLAGCVKNLFDFIAYEKEQDLDNPYYYTRREHFNLIVELSNSAAQDFRSKFEMSTQDSTDLKHSVVMLEMNRKIFQITGETEDLEKTKTLIESFQQKIADLESDDKKKKKKQ
ncbi:hypothetical protein [Leptospira ilyithenensis]|uniref:Uncharacterized protein n=1 Tax=Leptospira ilyithenensis TaxID=2484901 RepID=A0A4R9LSA7_9LEPT|nr:hypothetical protein [Leptospira ilyithenensis]TGN10223.1 hypothetical protein EHS11_10075 [Leptospira ilyithenensis]